jgi:hypothetical protein
MLGRQLFVVCFLLFVEEKLKRNGFNLKFFYWTGFTGFFGFFLIACFWMKQAKLNRLRRKIKILWSEATESTFMAFIPKSPQSTQRAGRKARKILFDPVNPVKICYLIESNPFLYFLFKRLKTYDPLQTQTYGLLR